MEAGLRATVAAAVACVALVTAEVDARLARLVVVVTCLSNLGSSRASLASGRDVPP